MPSLTPIFLSPSLVGSSSQIMAKQPTIGGLVGQATHGPQAKIDCPWSEVARFEMNPITEDNCPAEREPGLRAVPLHEFINRVPIPSLRVR